jgi:hypothetical protein
MVILYLHYIKCGVSFRFSPTSRDGLGIWEFRLFSGQTNGAKRQLPKNRRGEGTGKTMEKTENKEGFPLFHSKNRCCCCDGL